jgi:hypothetical protein
MASARVQNFGEFVFERFSSFTSASSAAIRASMADVLAGIGGSVSILPSWAASSRRFHACPICQVRAEDGFVAESAYPSIDISKKPRLSSRRPGGPGTG